MKKPKNEAERTQCKRRLFRPEQRFNTQSFLLKQRVAESVDPQRFVNAARSG